jgi:DNA-binding NtrC family response regulator
MIKGNILLIDDEKDLVDRVEMLLEDYADKIYKGHDGIEGLEVLKKEKIHCVVCDINMPRKNGIEVIKDARDLGYTGPFIFYTGHGNDEMMMQVVKFGVFDFLNKPNLEDLESSVERALKLGTGTLDPDNDGDYLSELGKIKN